MGDGDSGNPRSDNDDPVGHPLPAEKGLDFRGDGFRGESELLGEHSVGR
jgi:hypothetical protein